MRPRRSGEPVEYEVERPGTTRRLRFPVPVGRFTPCAARPRPISPFALAALAVWGMGPDRPSGGAP